MKKYFLGLFCLLIIASSLFVGVNKVSALTINNSTSTIATIVDTPTLKLSYDSSNSRLRNESLLTANFKVRVKAGNVDSVIYLNFANVEFVNKTGVSNQNANTKTTVITSSLGLYKENTDQYGRKYIIVPANSEVDFKVEATRKPSELFAGSYTASLLNLVNYNDSFEYGTQQIKVSENKTNSVTIVGEKSPYIESVSSTQIKCSGCDSIVTIKGVRMNNSILADSSSLYGQVSNWKVNYDGKTITFKTKIVGSYNIRLFDVKTGLSNGFVVNIESVAIEPLITITSPSKRTTVGNTFKASGSCTNYQGNVSVYYYSTRKVSVDALCSNGKWSTDINLETNALSGTFTLYASLSTGQQATLEIPFKIKKNITAEPSITISDGSGNQGLTVNVGDKFTILGIPKNLQGLQYGNARGNYSRAYFFDSVLFKDSCSNNEASTDGIWSMTCTAKNSGVGKFYIEIYKDGKTYRSNYVVVTVNRVIDQPLITSISPDKGTNSTVVTIYGSNLSGVSSVEFYTSEGRFIASIVSYNVTSNKLNFNINNVFTANVNPGLYQVGVVGEGKGGINSNRVSFTLNTSTTTCIYDYEDWGTCTNGTQTRTYTATPTRCTGTPVVSQTCTVTQPSITVLSPNGGEKMMVGSTYNITWKSNSLPSDSQVVIGIVCESNDFGCYGLMDGGSAKIATINNSGSYSWTIPQRLGNISSLAGAKYKVWIDSYYNRTEAGAWEGKSANVFTIFAPTVTDPDIYCGSKTQLPLAGGCGSKKLQVTQAGVVLSSSDVIEVIKISNYYRSGAKSGASIVACPVNTNYRVCVENGNDGVANYILLGVKSVPLNYNSSRTTATALESMKIEDIIQLLKMIK